MGDPSLFEIKGGPNPHTRTRWGFRKKVNREKALQQWHGLAKELTELGILVFVLPPVPNCPGTVYPANAGFLYHGIFYLSNLVPAREGERPHYENFIRKLGFAMRGVPYRFEGEADFFPAGDGFIFTYGPILAQRFAPRFGWPPWKRIYGFRSSERNLEHLRSVVQPKPVYSIRLVDEAYYHGDTVFCSFGSQRQFLLAYLKKIEPSAASFLREKWKDSLIELSDADGEDFAANSFYVESELGKFLLVPDTASQTLLHQIQARDASPVEVDVSEFMAKGGGSVKCMLCDLGMMELEDPNQPEEVRRFRKERLYQ